MPLLLGEQAEPTEGSETLVLDKPKFQIITGAMKAAEDGGRKTLHCTASSTIEDLHGDTMTEACLRDMAKQAREKNLTIFLNHRYALPEDAFGKVYASQVLSRMSDPETGKPIYDMDYDIALAESNPRVGKTWQLIKEDGLQLGVSIGAYILEYEFKDKDAGFWGGLIINKVLLVETSIVGIPANQRSWVEYAASAPWIKSAVKAIRSFEKVAQGPASKEAPVSTNTITTAAPVNSTVPLTTTTVTAANETVTTLTMGTVYEMDDDGNVTVVAEAGTPAAERFFREWGDVDNPTPLTLTAQQIKIHTDKFATEADFVASTNTDAAAPETPETPAAEATAEPTIETSVGETSTPEIALDVTEAAASLSVPENQEPILRALLAAMEQAATELTAIRAANAALETANQALTQERDQLQRDFTDAAQIIDVISRLPLGKKASFAAPIQTFRTRFAGIYSDDMLALIDSAAKED